MKINVDSGDLFLTAESDQEVFALGQIADYASDYYFEPDGVVLKICLEPQEPAASPGILEDLAGWAFDMAQQCRQRGVVSAEGLTWKSEDEENYQRLADIAKRKHLQSDPKTC